MKNQTILMGYGRILWLLILLANATVMSGYLFDRYSVPLPFWVCVGLHLIAWGNVVYAWLQFRRCLHRHTITMLQFFVVLRAILVLTVIIAVSLIRSEYFAASPSPEVTRYERLSAAVSNNDLAAVQAILAVDRQPDYVVPFHQDYDNSYSGRPLEMAVSQGNVAIAAALLQHGAAIRTEDPESDTFAQAAAKGDVPMLKLLLHYHAPVNNKQGNSEALWQAVQAEHGDAVDLLLRNGANPQSYDPGTDRYSESASVLHLARSLSNDHIARQLKQAGATEK
jgi:hypothetical protein